MTKFVLVIVGTAIARIVEMFARIDCYARKKLEFCMDNYGRPLHLATVKNSFIERRMSR